MNKKTIGIVGGMLVVAATIVGAVKLTAEPEPIPPPAPAPAAMTIQAPDKAKAGKLVVLSIESNAAAFAWQVVPATDDFLVIDDGKRAVFSSGVGGEFLFIVSAARENTVTVSTHTIKVIGPEIEPQPDDIGDKIPDWCETVDSPTKRDDALKLSQSFISVSATISAGIVTTPEEIVEATKESNREALGDNLEFWTPFLEALQVELKSQAAAGRLNDSEAHARMWKTLGQALQTYAEAMQ